MEDTLQFSKQIFLSLWLISHEVEVSLAGENGSYILTYALPQEWLAEEERQWPVVLDPSVVPNLSSQNIQDVTISSSGYSDETAEYLHCGYSSDLGLAHIFVKYVTLPVLKTSDVIVNAQLNLDLYGSNYETGKPKPIMEVHKVNGTWSSSEITWTSNPGFNEEVEDYRYVDWAGSDDWNVTDLVRAWYEGENTGMMFKLSTEAEKAQNLNLYFSSAEHSSYVVARRPTLIIVYRNNNGLESYWDYTSSSAGRAGTGYVNQYTGNLVWTRSDIGFGGNRMPVSISHIYNANDNDNNAFGMGYGWRTNFNQSVYEWSSYGTHGEIFAWEDSDGTRHFLHRTADGSYVDEDGLELQLLTNGYGDLKYRLLDKYGNSSFFDTRGRLTRQSNNQSTMSHIYVSYISDSSQLISQITDGAGRKYMFTYLNGLLSRISYTGTGTTTLSYVDFAYNDNSELVQVKDKDAVDDSSKGFSTYTYGENHLLTSAQDIDGYTISYSYHSTTAGQPNRIRTISESDGNVRGTNLGFQYAHNQTKLAEFYGDPNADELTWDIKASQLIQFNNLGNTIAIQDDEGRAHYAQYAINSIDANEASTASVAANSENPKANQLKLASKLQNTVICTALRLLP